MIRICGARHPSGLVCTCPEGCAEHQAWDHAAGRYVLWPAEERQPLRCRLRSTREWNEVSEREDNTRYEQNRSREAWRPDNDGLRIWRWL